MNVGRYLRGEDRHVGAATVRKPAIGSTPMKPDARIRMDVYQEGQRSSGDALCPYAVGDWRASTWRKGREDAQKYRGLIEQLEQLERLERLTAESSAVTSAGWTIRRVGHHLALESPEGDGMGITLREHGDVFRYFDALLKERGQ